MLNLLFRPFGFLSAGIACVILALSTGCASGGFKLTRKYAQFVNKQNIILRIVLYILTGIVFAVTLLVDMVIFNTMDFWQGKVSAGEYKFKEGEKTFHVLHEISPESSLKRSTVQVFDREQKLLQTVLLQETSSGEVELKVDGQLRANVKDVASLPMMAVFSPDGKLVEERVVLVETSMLTLAGDTHIRN